MDLDSHNGYIEDINRIKEDIYDNDEEWIDDFEELTFLEKDDFGDSPSKKEISNSAYQAFKQLERILTNLGIDIDEISISQTNVISASHTLAHASPQTIVQVSPHMYQSQTTDVSIHVNMQILIKEFEKEINQPFPDKSKLKSIMEKIKDFGKEHSGAMIDILLKNWDKIKFGGLFN